MNLGQKIRQEISLLKELYQKKDTVFSVGFSGGKDSTVALSLFTQALKEIRDEGGVLDKTVFVQFSDTRFEMPPIIDKIDKALKRVEEFAKESRLPIAVVKVAPDHKNTFVSLVIGKGYTLPRQDFRYCTDRLKIQPSMRFLEEMIEEHGGFIGIVGTRKEEGRDREKRLKDGTVEGHLKKHPLPNCYVYAPIEDWSVKDVWSYIYWHADEWVDADELSEIYKDASDDGDECKTVLEADGGEKPKCSHSSRFGCVICPITRGSDKTLESLANRYRYMKSVVQLRSWIMQYVSDWSVRDVYQHGTLRSYIYNKDSHRKGMRVPGGYTLEFRKKILEKFLDAELDVYYHTGQRLISDEELVYIQNCWTKEGDFEFSAVKIAKKFDRIIEPDFESQIIAGFGKMLLRAFRRQIVSCDNLPRLVHYTKVKDIQNPLYCAALVAELKRKREDWADILFSLAHFTSSKESVIKAIKIATNLRVEQGFFPTQEEEEAIRKEYETDRIGFNTAFRMYERGELQRPKLHLFGYDTDPHMADIFEQIDEFEEKEGDVTDCEKIPLEEQLAFLDSFREKSVYDFDDECEDEVSKESKAA